jgi:hypothetical protein
MEFCVPRGPLLQNRADEPGTQKENSLPPDDTAIEQNKKLPSPIEEESFSEACIAVSGVGAMAESW